MATFEAGTVERPRGEDEGAGWPGESLPGAPSGIASPVIPPDLLTFDLLVEGSSSVPEEPLLSAASIPVDADTTPTLAEPSDPAAVFFQSIHADHSAAPQVQVSASGGAFFHDWAESTTQPESHPAHHHAASGDLLTPWQEEESL